jgi:hypothetical protein
LQGRRAFKERSGRGKTWNISELWPRAAGAEVADTALPKSAVAAALLDFRSHGHKEGKNQQQQLEGVGRQDREVGVISKSRKDYRLQITDWPHQRKEHVWPRGRKLYGAGASKGSCLCSGVYGV